MKKVLLLLFVTPIYAMNKPSNDALISEKKTILKNTKVDSSNLQNNPEQICKLAFERYNSLGKVDRDSQITLGDVPTLIAKTYIAIKENRPEDAARLFAYFEDRASLDFQFLGKAQKSAYTALYCFLGSEVHGIQPGTIKKMKILERANRFKGETDAWIKDIVENNMCGDTQWRTLLAPDDDQTGCPSPKTLKAQRLKTINSYGTVQEMKK
jgi:hypothetical protein